MCMKIGCVEVVVWFADVWVEVRAPCLRIGGEGELFEFEEGQLGRKEGTEGIGELEGRGREGEGEGKEGERECLF